MPGNVVGEQVADPAESEDRDVVIVLTNSEYRVVAEALLDSEAIMVPIKQVPIWNGVMEAFENPQHPDDFIIDGAMAEEDDADASGSGS